MLPTNITNKLSSILIVSLTPVKLSQVSVLIYDLNDRLLETMVE